MSQNLVHPTVKQCFDVMTFAKQWRLRGFCFGRGIQRIFCYRFLRSGQVLGHQKQEIIHERKNSSAF